MENTTDGISHFLASEHGITSHINESEHSPVSTSKNVGYIVAAVLIEDGNVLMIRESKRSCYGQWYLPAGKMKGNESIEQAVKREVKEESSMDITVFSIIYVESDICWFRFTFVGECFGGTLKDAAQEDRHSIEAKWIPIDDVLNHTTSGLDLRETDILQLISLGASWYKMKQPNITCYVKPSKRSHSICLLRIFLFTKEGDSLFVFVNQSRTNFIQCIANEERKSLRKLVKSTLLLNNFDGKFTLHGLLSIEHTGESKTNGDGFLITVLAENEAGPVSTNPQWIPLRDRTLSTHIEWLMERKLCPPVR